MAESALRQYEYGGDGLFGAFMPSRKEVISPEQRLDQGYTSTRRGPGVDYIPVPAKYGEPESGFEYAPIVRGIKSALNYIGDAFSDPQQAIESVQTVAPQALGGLNQYMKDQYTAGALGGTAYNPQTGQVTEFNPIDAATMLAPSGFLTRAAATPGSVVLGMVGSKNTKYTPEQLEAIKQLDARGWNTEQLLLHGTASNFEGQMKPSGLGDLGPGNYLTGSVFNEAGDFNQFNFKDKLTSAPEMAGQYAVSRKYSNPDQRLDGAPNTRPMIIKKDLKFYDVTGGMGNDVLVGIPDEVRTLKQQGFDGIRSIDPETGNVIQTNVFDPDNVRSAFDYSIPDTPAQGQSALRNLTDAPVTSTSPATQVLPPLENAQKTQLGASTVPSYEKAKNVLGGEKILDFGAGRGQGASVIGADTYEPYPREGFNPTYSNPADIPDASYKGVTSLNVLNVVPRDVRDEIVTNIGRVMEPGGQAVITTRGRDVMSAKGEDGPEPMSRLTTTGTYQKGFTQSELRDYVEQTLGPNYTVGNLPQKIGAAGVLVKRSDAPVTNPSALRELDLSYDARAQRAAEQGYGDTLYHATSAENIDEFKPKPKYNDNLTFLALDPKFASDWIGKGGARSNKFDEPLYSMYKADREAIYNKYKDISGGLEMDEWPEDIYQSNLKESITNSNLWDASGTSVMPVRTTANNPFNPTKDESTLIELLEKLGKDPSGTTLSMGRTDLDVYKTGNYLLYETPEVVEFLKGKGFDSMLLAEDGVTGGGITTLAVFDPKTIRSANAAFDPSKRSSGNIMAGIAGTGVVGGSALSGQQQDQRK